MSNIHCATTLELNLNRKDYSPTTAPERNSQWMQLPHRWTRLSDLSTQSALKITELLFPDPWLRYGVQSTVWAVYCSAQPVLWWSDVQNTGDTMCKYKVQIQCRQFTVVLSRYFCACVWTKYLWMIPRDRKDSPMTGLAVPDITLWIIPWEIIFFQILLKSLQRATFNRLRQLVPHNCKSRLWVMRKGFKIHSGLLHVESRISRNSVVYKIYLQRSDNTWNRWGQQFLSHTVYHHNLFSVQKVTGFQ